MPSLTDLPDIAEGIPYGVGEAVETLARAGDVLGVPGMRDVIKAGEAFKAMFPQDTDTVVGTAVRGGIESTINSIAAGTPGLLGGLLGGPAGAVAGFAGSAGVVFGLAEYSRFMDELADVGRSKGLTDVQIDELKAEMQDKAIISGIAEGGLEAIADLVQAKLVGFIGKKALSAVAGEWLKSTVSRFLLESTKLIGVEYPSEIATSLIQTQQRQEAGIPASFGTKDAVDTFGAVVVQAFITKHLAGRIQRQKPGTPTTASTQGQRSSDEARKQDADARKTAADAAVAESPWLNETVPDPVIEDQPGKDAKANMMQKIDEKTGGPAKPLFNLQHLRELARQIGTKLASPTYFFRKEGEVDKAGVMKRLPEFGPLRTAFELDLIERKLRHAADEQAKAFDAMKVGLDKKAQEQAKDLLEHVLIARNKAVSDERRQQSMKEIQRILTDTPNLAKVLDGTKDAPGILPYFENMKRRYKDMLRQVLRLRVPQEQFDAFDHIIKTGTTDFKAVVQAKMNIEQKVREDQFAKGKDYDALNKQRQKALREKEIKKQADLLRKQVAEFKEIDNWGLTDYITRIELGSYRIHDADGQTYGFAETLKKARAEAYKIRQEAKAQGRPMPVLDISTVDTPKVDPTKPSRSVLSGARNIFDVLNAYDYSMQKRILMEPVLAKYEREKKMYPTLYDEQAQKVIGGQIEYIMGGKYSWGDQIVDKISKAFGQSTGKFTRGSAIARSAMTNAKLGYRMIAAMLNYAGGHGNTLIATGLRIKQKAKAALRAGVYEAPDGQQINTNKLLQDNMHLLGIDLTSGESGKLRAKTEWWKPLGLFTHAESSVRKHGFLANYIYMREKFGMQHNEAVTNALLNLTYQNFSYNLAALPAILRSPGSKLIGQFKSYMIFQEQFLSQLNGKQALRAMGVQAALGGPRSIVYVLKSIPILGAMGLLDEIEEYLLQDKGIGFDILARGVAGAARADITAAASMQLPSEPEDWAGVVLSTGIDLLRDVMLPLLQKITTPETAEAPGFIADRFTDWLKNLTVIYRYIDELVSSTAGYAINIDFTDNMKDFLQKNEMPEV